MEEKEIKAYIIRFHRDHGKAKYPTCFICFKDIKDEDKVEATKSRDGMTLVHRSCWKKEQKHG